MQRRIASESGRIRAISSLGDEWKNAHVLEGWAPRDGFTLTVVRAISARVNQNYDGWPSGELKKAAHTFVGKPIFINHHNDDPMVARGVVVASRYVESGDDKYIEVIQEVDAKAYPKLARELETGGLDSVSMGAEAGFTICSVCDNKATDLTDLCDHALYHKGHRLARTVGPNKGEEVLAYEDCYKIGFFELSYVFEPADETAVVSRVLTASKRTAAEMCDYCDCPATKEILHSEGHGLTLACEEHLDEAEEDAIHSTPDGTPDETNIVYVEDIKTARKRHAWGEVEAPAQVDTLRDDSEEQEEGYRHYIDSPAELSDPDLDEAKRLDRVQDESGGGPVDEDAAVDPDFDDDVNVDAQGDEESNPPRQISRGAMSNTPSTNTNKHKPTSRSSAMARQTLATRGQASRRRASNGGVANDQGVNDGSGEFLSDTPSAEAVSGGDQMTPDEHQTLSSDANPQRTDPQGHRSEASRREFEAFSKWVKNTYGVTIRRAAADNKLRTLVRKYAADKSKNVSLLMPGMKAALREANLRKRAEEEFYAEENPLVILEGDPEEGEDPRDVNEEDAPLDEIVDEIERAAEEVLAEEEALYEESVPEDEVLLLAQKRATRGQAAPKQRQAVRSASQRRKADNMDFAKSDDRVDVTAPVADATSERGQQSQYDTGEFANNAGDDTAKPDLSTDQNWTPGDNKSRSARVALASGIQAVRLAEAYIEAGIASSEQRWKLAGQFEQMPRSVVLDRTALLDQVVQAGAARKTAGGVTRSSTRPVVPQNFGSGSAPRTAAATNDSMPDYGLFF